MPKDAFKRLPPEHRKQILDTAMLYYLEKPYDEITIRDLAAYLKINVATFYRWFDEKSDICIEIARGICTKGSPETASQVFDEFASSEDITDEENQFMKTILASSEELRQRVFFEVHVDLYLPLVKQHLQMARLDSRLRDNVSDEFVAYLYVTMEYTLQRFKHRQGIKDPALYTKLKDYMLHSLLPYGIMKSDDTKRPI
ncbi:MAG TPA: TetR/AcrR family transcriptional regulator [Alphaproteobacteria bacterium]|nr:TetR/AcrR family transcriptional regulator [Alphaproteobacteria bacterium]